MEFDLLNLDDNVFKIHEETITQESQLFKLDSHFDAVMKANPTARFDGVFRARLSADLKQKNTNWEEFWNNKHLETGGKNVSVQFLTSDPDCQYVMESITDKLPRNQTSFFKAIKNKQAFLDPTPNCCSEILKEAGPKGVVKHFYEALLSKCIFVPKWVKPEELHSDISKKRTKFMKRQTIMQNNDPAIVCALIEQSMLSKTYEVQESQDQHDTKVCNCYHCHLNRSTEKVKLEPKNLQEDGDGESCALYFTDIVEESGKYLYVTPNFALSHLCHANMLTDLDAYYEGVSFPYVYIGGRHSHFALHIEDMSLPSFNFLHMGHPKLWIVVSPTEITKLSLLLSRNGLINLHRVCIFKLSHKNNVIFPQWLHQHDIKFKIIIQEPGDFVLLAPNASHTGGNLGLNVAEACNVGTMDWLPYGSVASTENCDCLEKKVHMDITPLLKIHRRDLLKIHESRSMSTDFNDDFFKRSIIGGVAPAYPVTEVVPTTVRSASKTKKEIKNKAVTRIKCPVESCFKTYVYPLKRQTLINHLDQEHPLVCKKRKVLNAVDNLFAKTS